MKRNINFLTYAFFNTTLFLPYVIYLLIGNQFDTYLNGWFPLIIFYVCNLTGTFLFESFDQKEALQKKISNLLLLACLGSLMGMFAFVTPRLLEFSSILLGLACSVLLPMYTTLVYNEIKIANHQLTTGDYVRSLISIFLFTPCVLFSVKFIRPEFGFLLYGIGFFYSYLTMRELPEYKVKNAILPKFNIRRFCLFVLLAGVTFTAKSLRVFTGSPFLLFLILAIAMLFLGCFFLIKIKKKSLSVFKYIYLFSFLQGASVNFMLLFGTFSLFTRGTSSDIIYLELYLSYGVGILLSLNFGNLVMNQFRLVNPIILSGIALTLSTLLMLFPYTIPASSFLIGFFGSINGRLLNRISYDYTKERPDRSLLYKNQWTKLGSIAQQSVFYLIIAGIGFLNRLPFTSIIEIVTGRTNIVNSTKLYAIIQLSGSIICGLICITYSISLYNYKKIN